MAWYIKAGMGGGYGNSDLDDWQLTEATNQKDADEWAWETACDDFESSGEFDYEAFEEEYPDAGEDEQWEAYCQERESWIYYFAEEFDTNPNEV